jgi:3-oxoacyl-[acyl-carrier protein] reductase
MSKLDGKCALVTGGNTGIGRAVVVALAEAGADIVVAWHADESAAQALVCEVQALGRRALAVQVDVTREDQVELAFETAVAALGHVDVLVNNAGVQQRVPILDMAVDDFDRMLAVHLRGAFLCSRAFARHRIAEGGGGRVINLCSQLGYIGRAEYTGYSTAKGGLIAFTRALARELAPHDILVNGVSPGLVDTGFDPLSEEAKQEHARSLPLKRLGKVDDMTGAFVFLASDESRYFCGQMLHPNGGEIMP